MALNLPNFLNAPIVRGPKYTPDYSGIANFIPQALQAYQTPFTMRHERMMNKEKYNEQAMKNALLKQYGEQEKQADIMHKMALAERMMNPFSAGARDIIGAYGGQTPEALQAILRSRGVFGNQGITDGENEEQDFETGELSREAFGMPFINMPKGRQNDEAKRMHADLRSANSLESTIPTIEKMQDIMKNNPNLYKKFAAILDKPTDSNILETIKQHLPEKDKTAVDLFGKYAADLVIKSGEAWGGGKNFTDARQALMQQRKPEVRKTSRANLEVMNELLNEAKAGREYAKHLRRGLSKGIQVLPNQQLYKDKATAVKEREPFTLGEKYTSEYPLSVEEARSNADKASTEELLRILGS